MLVLEAEMRAVPEEPQAAGTRLAIINVYAVNGTTKPYRDPKTGTVSGTRHDHKLRFHECLLAECVALQDSGFSWVLAGDFNVARSVLDSHPFLRTAEPHARNRNDFNDKFIEGEQGLGAIDTFRQLHGNERRYTYYPRGKPWGSGCDRVDLILMSRALVDPDVDKDKKMGLIEADICDTEAERASSDHVPLFATLDAGMLVQ